MKQNIYNFITPSDHVTFLAKNNNVAYVCAILVGGGKAGCENAETKENIPTFLLFDSDPSKTITEHLGCSLNSFIEGNKLAIIECLHSFAYGKLEARKTFDDACDAISDPQRLQEFKSKHEDRNRSSLNQIVQVAWNYAKNLQVSISETN